MDLLQSQADEQSAAVAQAMESLIWIDTMD